MAKPVVQLEQVSRSFPGVQALQDVTLSLFPGRIHALVGENGAGKSTLINILTGVLTPNHGTIFLDGKPIQFTTARSAHRQGIVVVHQELDLFPDLSIAENIGLEQGLAATAKVIVNWRIVTERTRSALQIIDEDLPPSLPVGELSPALRQMVLIAAAVSEQARVLILDEPTSSLSGAEAQVLFDHLRRFREAGTAILYVSHRLEEIFALADEVSVLRDGRRVWTGAIEDTIPDRLIAQMVGDKGVVGSPRKDPVRSFSTEVAPLFQCHGLSAKDGAFRDVTLQVHGGEIVGLYGLIGAGRSEWAQAVFGLRQLARGTILIAGREVVISRPQQAVRHGVAYVPEDRLRQGLCRGLTVLTNAVLANLRRFCRGPWISHTREKRQARHIVEKMGVRTPSLLQRIGTLSGGNQQKVVVGRWLDCEPQVLLLDEPTRGVDVGAKAEIHELIHQLAASGRAVIVISSDLPEVTQLCHRVGVFRQGRLAACVEPRTTPAAEIAATALPVDAHNKDNRQTIAKKSSIALLMPRLRELALLVLFVGFVGFLEIYTGAFLTWPNVDLIISRTALLLFPALGAAVVILAGAIDISLDRLMALCAGVAATLLVQQWPTTVVLLIVIALGMVGSIVNAAVSLWGRVHPIVVTLAMMSVFHGLVQWQIGGIIVLPPDVRPQLVYHVLGMPLLGLMGIGLMLVVWGFLTWTVPGREIHAFGGNPEAAHRVGIEHGRVWVLAFAIQGALVGCAGFLGLAYVGSVELTSFEGYTLQAIAAAVIGGVAITGGRGSVWGVLLGCLFLATLVPACIVLEVPATWQQTAAGGLMAAVVTLDALWRRPIAV